MVDVLYKFQTSAWDSLSAAFPSLQSVIASTQEVVSEFNFFLGIDIANSPMNTIMENYNSNILLAIVALLIPALAGLSQYVSVKITSSSQEVDPENPMASSMKMMTTTMPLISVFFCFTLPAGLGIYWIVSAVVRTIQQVIIKRHLEKESLEELIEKNREKAAKKREKKGITADRLNEMAQKNARSIDEKNSSNKKGVSSLSTEEKEAMLEKAKSNAKPGSLASKANMVRDYNEGK